MLRPTERASQRKRVLIYDGSNSPMSNFLFPIALSSISEVPFFIFLRFDAKIVDFGSPLNPNGLPNGSPNHPTGTKRLCACTFRGAFMGDLRVARCTLAARSVPRPHFYRFVMDLGMYFGGFWMLFWHWNLQIAETTEHKTMCQESTKI